MRRCCRCGAKKEDDYIVCRQCELEIETKIKTIRECAESAPRIADIQDAYEGEYE